MNIITAKVNKSNGEVTGWWLFTNWLTYVRQEKQSRLGILKHNIKANLEYSYAMPGNSTVMTIDGQLLSPAPNWKSGYTYDENKLSTAIVIEYGKFKYYEGGDQEYHNNGYPWELLVPDDETYDLDTVTPTAQVAGKVHVATLNHHALQLLITMGMVF
jgi:hypothetical protein